MFEDTVETEVPTSYWLHSIKLYDIYIFNNTQNAGVQANI